MMAHSESTTVREELAYSILVLERQLEAYRRLHEEEVAAMYQILNEIKGQIVEAGRQQVYSEHQPEDASQRG